MFVCVVTLLSLIISSSVSINVLVFSPAFAHSHMNFMGHLADTLTEAGHNVTFLVPIADEARRNKLGVKITKDIVIVEHDEVMKKEKVIVDDHMDMYWTTDLKSPNFEEDFKWFNEIMVQSCGNFLRNKDIVGEIRGRNIDVAILEPLSICGLGFFDKLGIKKTILASSCSLFDFILTHIGEPDDVSYVPSLISQSSDEMNILDRYKNYKFSRDMATNMYKMFDDEMDVYRRYLGGDTPDWRHLLPSASLFFTNSNPYLDFPRPIIQKTVAIGGISVDMDKIKTTKLSDEWNEILDRREKNMLISFGSMVKSSGMPIQSRQNILKAVKKHPDVTFIWKYETNETEWANGVDNIHFSTWVPQTALLNDDRLSAFMTHGGLGSTNELAHTGRPAVVVPIFGDQVRNAHMLSRQNGAIFVWKEELGNEKIVREAIHDILYNPIYTKHAKKLAEMLEKQPNKPKELVVKHTEFVAKYGPFPQMDPYGRQLNWFQRTSIDIYLLITISHLIVIITIFYIFKYLLNILPIRIVHRKPKSD